MRLGIVAVAILALCSPALAGEGVLEIASSEPVADWALDAVSGRVFASLPESSRVVEFDPESGEQVRFFDLPGEPGQLIIKGRRLVVALRSEPGLAIVDLESNEVAGHVTLAGRGAHALFASQVDNPWLWAVCDTGDAGRETEVFGVHLESLEVQRRVPVDAWSQSSPRHVAMSTDGRWIVADARGARSPSGADLMAVAEDEAQFEDRFHIHESFDEIVAGPIGRLWCLGNGLYTRDLSQKLRELPGSPATIHPQLDLVASVVMRQTSDPAAALAIVFERLTTATSLAEVPLVPREGAAGGVLIPRELGGRDDPLLVFDVPRGRLFHGWGQQAHVIDLAALDLEVEPLLRLAVPVFGQISLGTTWRGVIGANDSELLSLAQLSLDQAPPGMELKGREVTWTPGAEAVGHWDVSVIARDGEVVVDRGVVSLDVAYPAIDLGGEANGVAVDEAGRRALVWRDLAGAAAGSEGASHELVLVDLKAFSVVAREAVEDQPRAAVVSSGVVYLLGSRGDEVVTRSAADLSLRARTPLAVPAETLAALPAGGVIAVGDAGEVALAADGVRQLWSVASPAWGHGSVVESLADGLLVGPRVLPPQGRQPAMLVWPQWLPAWPRPQDDVAVPSRWSRQVSLSGMTGADGPTARWTADRVVLLRRQPAAVTAEIQAAEKGASLLLSWWDVVNQEPRHTQVVSSFLSSFAAGPLLLAEAGAAVVVISGERLFLVPSPGELLADLPAPLQVVRRIAPTVIGADDQAQIQIQARGGEDPYQFSLRSVVAGLTMDEQTGVVVVDGPAIWDQAFEKGFAEVERWQLAQEDRGAGVARLQAYYAAVMGEATERLPLSVPLEVEVRDASGQVDRLVVALIVVGPVADLARVERAEARPPLAPSEVSEGDRGSPPALAALAQKIESLEAQLTDLSRRLSLAADTNEQVSRASTEPLAYGLARTAQQLGALEERLTALNRRLQALEKAAAPKRPDAPWRMRSLLLGMLAAAAIMGGVLPRTGR